MIGASWGREPPGFPKQLCPDHSPSFSVLGHSLGAALVPEPLKFLGSSAVPGATIVACGCLGLGLFFEQSLSFCFAFSAQPLAKGSEMAVDIFPCFGLCQLLAAPLPFQGPTM